MPQYFLKVTAASSYLSQVFHRFYPTILVGNSAEIGVAIGDLQMPIGSLSGARLAPILFIVRTVLCVGCAVSAGFHHECAAPDPPFCGPSNVLALLFLAAGLAVCCGGIWRFLRRRQSRRRFLFYTYAVAFLLGLTVLRLLIT